MARFKDSTGHDWALGITFGHTDELKACGIDLAHPSELEIGEVLYTNPFALVNILWALVKAQANGTSREAFLEALDAEALDRASDALAEAIVDFIHRRRAPAVKARMPELMAAVDKAHAKKVAEALDSTLRNLSGGSPESSASTPGP
jgi:hypothetical protein